MPQKNTFNLVAYIFLHHKPVYYGNKFWSLEVLLQAGVIVLTFQKYFIYHENNF
jgi:hypothetical protein